ncbi:MAG TPA: phosphopantetheine-binding protein [Burkholderiales bacterium]|nr:phosphopantetheine-binding protein [Burkholderiales bacterium]
MPPPAALVRELSDLFRDKLFIDVPSAETDLIDSGLLDSLQLVQLLLQVEQQLGLRLPLEEVDLDDLRSIARLAKLICARTAKAA